MNTIADFSTDSEIQELNTRVASGDKDVKDYLIINDKLFRVLNDRKLLVEPRRMKKELVSNVHSELAHLGMEKTLYQLRKSFYFTNMQQFVKKIYYKLF